MIHAPGGMERKGGRFPHITQKDTQFKMYEFLISGIFRLIVLCHNSPWATETAETETEDKGNTVFLWGLVRSRQLCLATGRQW